MKLLLFSGGLDSSALAFWKRPDVSLTIDYGQKPARGEIRAARSIASQLKLNHEVLKIDLSRLGTGDLAGRRPSQIARASEFWPYRNQMLITLAAMAYLPKGLKRIIIGAVSTDIHADGTREFITKIDDVLSLQEGAVRVEAPAIRLTGPELLRRSKFPIDLIGLTFSCHVMERPCGQCRGCIKHADTMRSVLQK